MDDGTIRIDGIVDLAIGVKRHDDTVHAAHPVTSRDQRKVRIVNARAMALSGQGGRHYASCDVTG